MKFLRSLFNKADADGAVAQIMVHCAVTRESVAMGDDVTAPNARAYDIAIAADAPDPALRCIEAIVQTHDYLPSVQNGSTWVIEMDGQAIAVASKIDGVRNVITLPDALDGAALDTTLTFYCRYYLGNDPQRIAEELATTGQAKIIYGEAHSGDAVPHWPDPVGAKATVSSRMPHGADQGRAVGRDGDGDLL